MKNILIILSFFLMSCAATKTVYVPTEAKTIIEYRDTTIYLEKVIEVPVPVERVVEVVPRFDTLKMETSVAKAECWADTTNRVLRGRMKNKQTALKGKLDTIVRVEYVNEYIEVPIIKELEVEMPYIPKIGWICIIFTCCWAVAKIAKIIWKFKGGI